MYYAYITPVGSRRGHQSVGMCFQVEYYLVCKQSHNMRWSKAITTHALIKSNQRSEVNVFHNLTLFYLGSHKNKLDKTQCINFWLV